MDLEKRIRARRVFVIVFIVLTSLCWCPWAYGTVTGRTLAIPTWAVLAYACATALFLVEWVFLFLTGLAVRDDEVAGIVSELDALSDVDASAKERA